MMAASETKAELLQEGIFFLIHLFARDVLVMKKLEIEKNKPTFIISVLKVEYWVVLVSWISNFFTDKTSLANKWMSFSSSNSASTICVVDHELPRMHISVHIILVDKRKLFSETLMYQAPMTNSLQH